MAEMIETICGYSCTECNHHGVECPGCGATGGKPFWATDAGVDACPVYDCCANKKNLPHCGRCPDLMCEQFSRSKNPDTSEEEAKAILLRMEQEIRAR